MKHFTPLLFIISFFVIIGCNDLDDDKNCDSTDFIYQEVIETYKGGCNWDGYISNTTAKKIQKNWQKKWEFPKDSLMPIGTVPDSFFVNLDALEKLALSRHHDHNGKPSVPCGFRIYYGLTRPGDITSMGLVITAIDTGLTDQVFGKDPQIIFTNNSLDSLNQDSLKFPLHYINLDSAISYTTNWRHYNGICLENDTLGNKVCPYPNLDRKIPPKGSFPSSVKQIVPLGQAYSGLSVFEKILCEQPNSTSLIICNAMFPLNDTLQSSNTETGVTKGYRYDFYLRGFNAKKDSGRLKIETKHLHYAKEEDGCILGNCPVDISNGCPPFCDIEDILQRDGAKKPSTNE